MNKKVVQKNFKNSKFSSPSSQQQHHSKRHITPRPTTRFGGSFDARALLNLRRRKNGKRINS
jgi:hypothetical protein